MSRALLTDLWRSIRNTKARFISIIAIVMLGISFFAGMKATQPDMIETADRYFRESNLMDISVLSTVGLTDSDIYQIQKIPQVQTIMPTKFVDGLLYMDGQGLVDIDGSAFTCRAISMNFEYDEDDASAMNRLQLLEGDYPDAPNECVVDKSELSTPEEFEIGKTITLVGDREDLSGSLESTELTIVGIIRSPNYISFERGNTLIGTGKLGTFVYAPYEAFKRDYYTQLYIKLEGSEEHEIYSENYENFVKSVTDRIQEIADERVSVRCEQLRKEIEPKVTQGKATLAEKEKQVAEGLAAARKQAEEVKYYATEGPALLADAEKQFTAGLSAGQQKLMEGRSAYDAGMQEFWAKQALYQEGLAKKAQNPGAEEKYNAAKLALDEALVQIQQGEKDIASGEAMLSQVDNITKMLTGGNKPTELIMTQLKALGFDTTLLENFRQMTAIGLMEEAIALLAPNIKTQQQELEQGKKDLAAAKILYNQKLQEYQAATPMIEQLRKLDDYRDQLEVAANKLGISLNQLDVGELKLQQEQLKAQQEIEKKREQIQQAQEAAPTIDAKIAQEEAKYNAQLAAAREEIDYGERQLANLDTAQWMIGNRNDISGYTTYRDNAGNVAALGSVLPLVFFAVAAMVCLTTMSRMVEEERTQMGTLKAMGYGSRTIATKYVVYALLASLIGSVIGLGVGFTAIPIAVTAAFGIMFDMPNVLLNFQANYAITGILIAVGSTVVAAVFGCRKELVTVPAQLMRPKAPKAGKRVFLEHIGFLWTRLNFSMKVTVRNLFRNKRRMIMTLAGIMGSTALLLASFGLGDSIGAIIGYQYGNNGISNFDIQLVLKAEENPDVESAVIKQIKSDKRVGDVMLTHMKVLNGSSDENKDKLKEINVLVPQTNEKLSEFVNLKNRDSGEAPTLTDEGALITEKFAEHCNAKPGDEIFIRLSDNSEVRVPVAGIVENYTFHYVYMSRTLYERTFGAAPEFNSAYAKLDDSVKSQASGQLVATKNELADSLMKLNTLKAVVYTTQIIDTFDNIIKSLNLVIIVFLIAAGALALVVLYNLSNININERIREIATIKVLGFTDGEVSSYMYRENIFLTIFGIGLGVLGGSFLHQIISSVVDINVVMLGKDIEWTSYIYAILMSIGLTVLVNVMMHRKLKTISMVESLKSVE